jgi:hypothetical protein
LPDGKTVAQVARNYSLSAIETLFDICTDPEAPKATRVSAADALLDRGWGKAKQILEHGGADGQPLPTIEIRLVQPVNASGGSQGD